MTSAAVTEAVVSRWAEFGHHLGLSLIPLYPVVLTEDGGRCSCWDPETCQKKKRVGKHPRDGKGWQNRRTLSARDARALAIGGNGLGVLTGAVSRALVIDCDPRNGGTASLEALVTRRGPLPATFTVLTGRGDEGRHYYYRLPEGVEVRASKALGEGVDVKGRHGFVTFPPSLHASGGHYALAPESTREIAPLPVDLLELLRERERPSERLSDHVLRQPNEQQAKVVVVVLLSDALTRVAGTQEGQRNSTLNATAYGLGSLVAERYLDVDHVARGLVEAAMTARVDFDEALATTWSGLAAGVHDVRPDRVRVVEDALSRVRRLR